MLGFSTDGEFNSLRTMGNHEVISIIKLIMNAKTRARSISVKMIREYLTPVNREGVYITIYITARVYTVKKNTTSEFPKKSTLFLVTNDFRP